DRGGRDGAAGGAGPGPRAGRGLARGLPAGGPHRPGGPRRRPDPRPGHRCVLRPAPGAERVSWVNAVVQGVLLGGFYALLACGLSIMFGVMRIINLAHGDLAVLGAYLVWLLLAHASVP